MKELCHTGANNWSDPDKKSLQPKNKQCGNICGFNPKGFPVQIYGFNLQDWTKQSYWSVTQQFLLKLQKIFYVFENGKKMIINFIKNG